MQRSSAPPGRRRSLAGALSLVLALAACGSGTATTGSAPPSSAATPAAGATPTSATPPTLPGGSATTAAVGGGATTKPPADPKAPRLDPAVLQGQAATIDGTSFDLGSLAGKDLVVWFWAPW